MSHKPWHAMLAVCMKMTSMPSASWRLETSGIRTALVAEVVCLRSPRFLCQSEPYMAPVKSLACVLKGAQHAMLRFGEVQKNETRGPNM